MNKLKIGCLLFVLVPMLILALISTLRKKTSSINSSSPEVVAVSSSEERVDTKDRDIPGVMPVDIYLNLKNKGFGISKEFNPCCSWIAVEGDSSPIRFTAEIYGTKPNSFHRVNASVSTTIDKNTKAIAKPFFGYIATLAYTNSDPQKARKWVEYNTGKATKTTIGGVVYELSKGQSNGLTLSIYRSE